MASFEVHVRVELLAEGFRLVRARDGQAPEFDLEAGANWRQAVESFCARALGERPVHLELVDAKSIQEGLFGRLWLIVRGYLPSRSGPADCTYRWESLTRAAAAAPAPGARLDPAAETLLYTDGGSRGNPGPAGIGLVLEQQASGYLEEQSRFIGVATSNAAEYTALIEGLKLALERGVRRLEHRSDSQLLVRQLEGLYKVKSVPLARLHDQARSLIKAFESFISRHVLREQNLRADRLANLALDEQEKSAQ
ncbi:MAG TPA: ribonuclease HI family protein [Candidatus Glassbacteria bacterium]|nr:ribonuclease HI family protein [Candidatus Glassbacteria bacterium]